MNTVLFVNAAIGFSENLFLVMLNIHAEFHLPTKCQTFVIVMEKKFKVMP